MTRQEPPARGDTPLAPQIRQRIAKLMARVGLCSRRDAEAWIVAGRVSVNGTILTSPALDVGPQDAILVDGAPLPGIEKTRLFLFHKPRGLVTSDHDPEGRATVAGYLRENWPEGPRVVTIGRLDINTEGLLLLTNDGGLARVLELPKTGWLRRYRVRAKGTADVAALDALAHGITIDGVDYAGIEAKLDRVQGANSWLTMGLREGKNREIKRVLEHLGLEVNRLIRLSFGPFQLQDLPEGAVEEVRPRVLRDQLGSALAAEAGIDLDTILPEPPREDDRSRRPDKPHAARKPPTPPEERPRKPFSDRPARSRRDATDDAPPLRDRPVGGTRKHVSTLRRAESDDARKGPRKRIERTDTQDRRDRTIKVERLVSTRPVPDRPPPRRRPQEDHPTEGRGPRTKTDRERSGRSEHDETHRMGRADAGRRPSRGANDRADVRKPGRADHASPSALGKRERVARSGARPNRSDRADAERSTGRGPDHKARAQRADTRRPDSNKRVSRPSTDRAAGRKDGGIERRGDSDRPARPRAAHDQKNRSTGKPTGRPMGAASRKPGGRKPAGGGVAPHRGKPPSRGPNKPKL